MKVLRDRPKSVLRSSLRIHPFTGSEIGSKDNHNLFKDTMAQTPTMAPQPTKPKLDFKNMTSEQYLKIRAEHPEWLGLDPWRNKRR